MESRIDPREISLTILLDIETNQVFSNTALANGLRKIQFEQKQDRAFISRLVEGVTEYRLQLDAVIQSCSSTPLRKMKPLILSVLRMTAYQILYMDSVPDHAAVSEAVRLVKKHKFQGLTGFVNAVSRSISRRKESGELDAVLSQSLSVRYSTPEIIVELLREQYGEEATQKILEAAFTDRDTTIRVNTNKLSREQLKQKLEENGIMVRDGVLSDVALHISQYDFIRKVPGFRQGDFLVQDESSMCAVEALGIEESDRVLELCAAPGGKSLYAAMLAVNGSVRARDLTEEKTNLIRENAERLGITNIEIEEKDASELDEEACGLYDCVIADVPCSGLGVMGRKNDIKYHITKEGLEELEALGRTILMHAGHYVAKGGKLLFSTCTINKRENEENVKAFLAENTEFQLMEERTFLQGIDPCDGFFYAVMKRAE